MAMTVADLLARFDVEFTSSGEGRAKLKCPFHPDEHPSGLLHLDSGLYRCLSANCNYAGDAYDLVAKISGQPRAALMALSGALDEAADAKAESVDPTLVEQWHQNLLKNSAAQRVLLERKGITAETIVQRRLGWQGDRVAIPIYSGGGLILNVRLWSPVDPVKKVIGLPGRGRPCLYPIDSLAAAGVILAEGELKALLLCQQGIPAVSSTAGADSWLKPWAQLFERKIVGVAYDIDDGGQEAARRHCRALTGAAKRVQLISLPLDRARFPTGGVDDYLLRAGFTAADFAKLWAETPTFSPAPLAPLKSTSEEVLPVLLADSSLALHFDRRVKTSAIISAKDVAPYVVPRTFTVHCLRDQPVCGLCPFGGGDGAPTVEIKSDDPLLLELVNTRADKHPPVLRRAAQIPAACRAVSLLIQTVHNIEELRLISQLRRGDVDQQHVVRRAFYVGHGIETNAAYELTARAIPEPNTQYATLLIYDAKPAVDSLSQFALRNGSVERLRIFNPATDTVEGVEAKLAELYADLAANVTRIHGRPDLHLIYDLAYHSVLYLDFQGIVDLKGWAEVLVLGDSSQGKSVCFKHLMEHYGVGEKVDCKSASIAGLLGGLQETAKRWFISWGVITLNDKRLVALEEAKGLPAEIIARMTDVRSSGVVEISKIEKARTNCRCRLVWISNPRSERSLETYNYGIEAIREFAGALEDVRRFDCALIVSSKDVDHRLINVAVGSRAAVPHTHTADLCRTLVLWAWSRRKEHVIFALGSEDAILAAATRLSQKYAAAIPLVEAGDQRLKLARLAAALAARLFSTPDGQSLLVKPCHVEAVVRFLERAYDAPAFGYFDYSRLILGEQTLEDEPGIGAAIALWPCAADAVTAMLEANVLAAADLTDWGALTFDEAKIQIGYLVRKRALKRYKGGYLKTPAFTRLLKNLQASGKLKPMAPPPPYVALDNPMPAAAEAKPDF